jgi:hypothetical protein
LELAFEAFDDLLVFADVDVYVFLVLLDEDFICKEFYLVVFLFDFDLVTDYLFF